METKALAIVKNQAQPPEVSSGLERVLINGDLSRLSEDQCVEYYKAVCESVGLNPLTKPFQYHTFKGQKILYLVKAGAQQLCMIHSISFEQSKIERIGDLYCVTVMCKNKEGRTDSDMAALDVKGLTGEALANAMMKCMTKAKRRVTLSICGLSMLDESEIEDMERSEVQRKIEKIEAIDATPAARTVEADGSIVDTHTGEVLGNTNAPRKEGPFTYALPVELPGVNMEKLREQIKKQFGGDTFDPERKVWHLPRKLKNSAIDFDQFLIAVTPAQEIFGNDDINI